MQTRDRLKRLEALEAAQGAGVCVGWPEDDPPRYVVDGRVVDAETFERRAPFARTVIIVRYEEGEL